MFMRKSIVIGSFLLTTTIQGAGAPLVDKCYANSKEGDQFKGICVLLMPWKRDKYGASVPQLSLVIGWKIKTRLPKETEESQTHQTIDTGCNALEERGE